MGNEGMVCYSRGSATGRLYNYGRIEALYSLWEETAVQCIVDPISKRRGCMCVAFNSGGLIYLEWVAVQLRLNVSIRTNAIAACTQSSFAVVLLYCCTA